MIVGELRHGQLTIIDRLKETVRLSEGLTDNGPIAAPARQRALDCLSRFGERLRAMHASSVRTAGTSTLRRASDSDSFRLAAEAALGHPIEVISGIEEARLVYMGVLHSLPRNDGMRLVLDIGGGSTELILGQGATPRALESLHMGCVVMTEKHFPGGRIDRASFDKARLEARLKLRPVKNYFRRAEDVESVGTSGTIISTEAVARELGIIESNDLTPAAVELLIERVLEYGHIDQLQFSGLSDRRAQVWPGGLAILVELLQGLRIGHLRVSDGALREGLLYDQLGRLQHDDARDRSVAALAGRYNVDQTQAARVRATAEQLLAGVADQWNLTSPLAADILEWAATLHEIGLDISHSGFQRHGAYVAENADLPGFPRSEQILLASLIANQRSSIDVKRLQALPNAWQDKALALTIVLRLAVLLNRNRSDHDLPPLDVTASAGRITLGFPDGWLDWNPLTIADLNRERGYLAAINYEIEFGPLPDPIDMPPGNIND